MSRPHWENCVAHFDDAACTFVDEYFADKDRRCLVVAAAGFDPRSRYVTEALSKVMGDRLTALFVREERGKPDAKLLSAADKNQKLLQAMVPNSTVEAVEVFGQDNAPVGGARIAGALSKLGIPDEVTDVVLDMTAMSIGIGFPAARLLLEACEAKATCAFHIIVASDPDLDDKIVAEPGSRPMVVKGFAGPNTSSASREVAQIWIPQLSKGKIVALDEIGRSIGECYKICPLLPFPSCDPRRADTLITEYRSALVEEWQVDPRDFVYASERNPLDCYRTLSTLTARHRQAVEGVLTPSIVVSPIGSRVMSVGALMAALEHNLAVQYIETVRYEFDPTKESDNAAPEHLVHLLLSGPAYGSYKEASE